MENANSRENKIEVIQNGIQQVIDSNHHHDDDHDHHHHHQLLSNIVSQLEALKADGVIHVLEPETRELPACEAETEDEEMENEEIVKELKKLKKQNKVTHWLLSALILVTVAWQLSEVSLLLKFKEGLTNPFKSVGNMFKDIIKPRRRSREQDDSIVPGFELPELVTSDEKE